MIYRTMRAMQPRAWRAYADARRVLSRAGSASSASPALAGGHRAHTTEWTDRLARQHHDYRAAVTPLADQVAIVCVSRRPHLLGDVVEAAARQNYHRRELVLVTNSDSYDDMDVDRALESLAGTSCRATVLRRAQERSLGACLNDAMESTDARFIAKFDDDDLYGPEYLSDAMRAHAYAGAAVVGKHTYYAYLSADDRTILRFPAHEFTYSSTLAGGTLVIDRERTGDLRFDDVSLGEDWRFIRACHRLGHSTFSADRFNFVQVRSGDNTWTVKHSDFLEATVDVDDGLPRHRIDL